MNKNDENELYIEAKEQLKRLFLVIVAIITTVFLFAFGLTGIFVLMVYFVTGSVFNTLFAYTGVLLFLILCLAALYAAWNLIENFCLPQCDRFIEIGTMRAIKGNNA